MAKNVKEYVINTISNFDEMIELYLSRKTCKELKVLENKIHALRKSIITQFVKDYQIAFDNCVVAMGYSKDNFDISVSVNCIYMGKKVQLNGRETIGTKSVVIYIERAAYLSDSEILFISRPASPYPGEYPGKISGEIDDVIKFSEKWMGVSPDYEIGELIKNYFKELLDMDWLEIK